jgi:site-specific DNA-methyltransferase (adenine-specific)
MILSETEFSKLPLHLQKLFARVPNPDADAVEVGFPQNIKDDNIGSASRYFYCAKANKRDRDEGLEHLPDRILAYSNGAQAAVSDGAEEYTGGSTDIGLNNIKNRKNHHPTVKHTDLMRYLVRLVTPPNGVCLDPFMGSGSTGKACMYEGFQFIGIELDSDYVEIAKNRIEFAVKQSESEESAPKKIAAPRAEKEDAPPQIAKKKRGRPPKTPSPQIRLI